MSKLTERKLILYLSAEVHDKILKTAHKNKLINLQESRKGKDKLPDSVTALVRIACEKEFLKK